MRCRNRTTSHDRCHNRDLGTFYKFGKCLIRSCNIYPTTGKEQRFLCFSKHLNCSLKLSDVNTGTRLISADIHFIRILGTSQFSHYIFWKVDQYRSRPSCSCNIKCFFQDTSEVFPVSDRNTIFRNASGDSDNSTS